MVTVAWLSAPLTATEARVLTTFCNLQHLSITAPMPVTAISQLTQLTSVSFEPSDTAALTLEAVEWVCTDLCTLQTLPTLHCLDVHNVVMHWERTLAAVSIFWRTSGGCLADADIIFM